MTTNILTDSQNNIKDNTNNWTKYYQIKSIHWVNNKSLVREKI